MEFNALGAFVDHVIGVGMREQEADALGRRAVAETVVHTAQSMIGHPSNFVPLAQSTVRQRLRLGYTPYATLLRTGDYQRSFMWAHEGARATGAGSNSEIARYHEEGTPNNRPPKRSVLIEPTRARDRVLFNLFGKTYFVSIRA